jgi:Rhodopirellula transposase DDE domain
MGVADQEYVELLRLAAGKLTGSERRVFVAEVALRLCAGNARQAEERFGWGRETVRVGLRELETGIVVLGNFAARGRSRIEELNPKLADDIREIAEPQTQTDPELKSARRYLNLSAREVRTALIEQKGWSAAGVPSERSLRRILNRMNYRLKRIQKGKPLKKTKDTDAIFENVKAVQSVSRGDPETLEISVDTKAKVAIGDYSRGGKNPDRIRRKTAEGVGS